MNITCDFFLTNYLKNVCVVLKLHTNLKKFSEGMFLKTEDCEGVSSYIQVHMVTMVLNRCTNKSHYWIIKKAALECEAQL